MESPIAKIMMLGATIAITTAVVLFGWTAINSNTPDLDDPLADKSHITDESLCRAVKGTWSTSGGTGSCS